MFPGSARERMELDRLIEIRYTKLGKWKRFKNGWNLGRRDHFPICCIIRWSVVNAFRDGKTQFVVGQAMIRGRCYTKDGQVFVPCGIFHRRPRV